MSNTTTFSMRVDTKLLEHIDQSAAQQGQTRTDYVLSWLPDNYKPTPRNTKPPATNGTTPHR